ncbi:MAG: enoyl-CoA hydratase [Acidimicrobiales bacterium]|nr:MAG: enoyl-CoA hydratase [Acidimicrobiales bacterium]
MNALVHSRIRGPIAHVTLDSPSNRNALSVELIEQLCSTLRKLGAQPAVRAVVLNHTGSTFCSGVNLRAASSCIEGVAELLATVWEHPVPVIAAVSGAVRGGGLGLLCATDIVVASTQSSFSFSEVRVGVVPGTIWPLVAGRIAASARYLLLTGETFNATQAQHIGLVTATVNPEQLDDTVATYASAVLQGAPGAVMATKRLLRTVDTRLPAEGSLRELLRPLAAASGEKFNFTEAREGRAAFADKRSPSWVPHPQQDT